MIRFPDTAPLAPCALVLVTACGGAADRAEPAEPAEPAAEEERALEEPPAEPPAETSERDEEAPAPEPEQERETSIAAPDGRRVELDRAPGEKQGEFCEPKRDLVLRLRDAGGDLVDEYAFAARCTGACTEEARRRGEERVAEIEERIEAGEAGVSELDYNFTRCLALGHRVADRFDEADRPVFLISSDTLGPHSVITQQARLATVGCGGIQVSDAFFNPHADPSGQDFSDARVHPIERDGATALRLDLPSLFHDAEGEDDDPLAPAIEATFSHGDCAWRIDPLDG